MQAPYSLAAAAALAAGYILYKHKRMRAPVMELPRLDGKTCTPSEVYALLRSHGVVVIDEAVPGEVMDRVVTELDGVGGTFVGGKHSFAGHHTRRNAAKPLGESTTVQELAVHPTVLGGVEALLGPWCKKVCLGTCSCISVEPHGALGDDEPCGSQVLHRDDSMWGASSWRWLPQTPLEGRPQLSVSCMWAVADFTASNGATRFLPGSHTWYRDGDGYGEAVLPPGVSDAAHAVQAAMRKGSCVLWAGGTLHGASGQRKGNTSSRRGLLFIYNLGYLKPEHNFHWSMPHEVMMTFGERLLDLIGYTGANAVDHPWYRGPVYTQPYLGGGRGSTAGDGVQF
eukprot:CAMPEP_0185416554 /NCGR_PEP_ID=MMETSP1365-20130426/7316_1 /TAXON_ID=38817 /ORGANISM="Gephyrocapsa oceanica, Strain RCC1303" /LENGTH=339 /DNA_ID=CAMNT_0028019769 /DNA_START=103 /DNA_END=1122 /DNA_ORIENTATION=-